MKYIISLVCIVAVLTLPSSQSLDAVTILKKVDANMVSKTKIIESKMVISGTRTNRTIASRGYSEGNDKSFTEYLSPEREKGTKMLKLDNMLWIYSPETDRIIQLSGHLLRQSVMGSDLSYEDMMETRKLTDIYNAKVIDEEKVDGRNTWILELNAKVTDVNYVKCKIWIDQERFVPLIQEFYAKSGQLLKKTTLSNVERIGNRWFPKKVNYKDMLKNGQGTDFIIDNIKFDVDIPDYIFSKASLKK